MRHQYEMGLIGNNKALALVEKKDANICWWCLPDMDSSFVFGSLLDNEKGGSFKVCLQGNVTSRQSYIKNTAVLVTDLQSEDASVRVTDFAPRGLNDRCPPNTVIRKIESLHGPTQVKIHCYPIYNYGEHGYVLHAHEGKYNDIDGSRSRADILEYTFGNFRLYVKGLGQESQSFQLIPHEPLWLIISNEHTNMEFSPTACEELLRETCYFWNHWIHGLNIPRLFRDEVLRSAITLKLHQDEETGSVLAASTMALPEAEHSGRNWDYRYCWFRDAYYATKALYELGSTHELENYARFLGRFSSHFNYPLQPMYSLRHRSELFELELPLKGYRNNRPVRLGNLAYRQVQNDSYGQIIASLEPLYTDGRLRGSKQRPPLENIHRLLARIEYCFDDLDASLWEFRTKPERHCYTYFFHWLGAKSALRIAEVYRDQRLAEKARKIMVASSELMEEFFDSEDGCYYQIRSRRYLDASLFQLIIGGYLDPASQRAKSHFSVLSRGLKAGEHLYFRYILDDDFGKPENSFHICSFWNIECLALLGYRREAYRALVDIYHYSNDLGLMSEDVDQRNGSQWGNFPQAYSHAGFIMAALRAQG